MESVLLGAPSGISVRFGADERLDEHERKRLLAREVVASLMNVEVAEVRVHREEPAQFGYHPHLLATVAGSEIPLAIRSASTGPATVVVAADPVMPLGVDLRSATPAEADLRDMRAHSHLFGDTDEQHLLAHWTRVHAVLHADGRGARVRPEHVRLDPTLTQGWIPDRRVHYRLLEIPRESWAITLAYGAFPL